MLRTLLMLAFWIVVTPPAALVTVPWALLTGNVRPLYSTAMWIVCTGLRIVGLRVTAEGLERLGQAMRVARLVPIDRRNRERAVTSLDQGAAVLRDGINMTVFVEGTRSADGKLLPFKKGPFYLAEQTGVPVVPVTILGTFEAQPKGQFAVRPGEARVIFHPPVQARDFPDREAFIAAVRERIASVLPETPVSH